MDDFQDTRARATCAHFASTALSIATMASKPQLDEAATMSSIIMKPLNDLQELSQTLFMSLSPAQTKPPPPPPVQAFQACDQALADAITLAHTHQIKQGQIEALKAEILQLDARWREICIELDSGKRELEEIIEEGDERIKAIDEAKKGALSAKDTNKGLTLWQLRYLIQSSWHMLRASARSPPRLPICLISAYQDNNPRHYSFRHSRTKRRCAEVVSMPKPRLVFWAKHILWAEV